MAKEVCPMKFADVRFNDNLRCEKEACAWWEKEHIEGTVIIEAGCGATRKNTRPINEISKET